MRAYMSNTKMKMLKTFANKVMDESPDAIFVCTKNNRTAVKIDFEIPMYYLNPKEEAENTIMYKFLQSQHDNFFIVKSELLSIPNVKEIHQILGDSVSFFGILNDIETKDNYLSSYYLMKKYYTDEKGD